MLTAKQIGMIDKWKKDWSSKTQKIVITGCETAAAVISIAIDRSCAPRLLRALKLYGASTTDARAEAKELLQREFPSVLHRSWTPESIATWSADMYTKIRAIYRRYGITDYTLGNAQKLLNMTTKYIFSSDIIDPDCDFFKHAHIPIERIIMKVARARFGIKPMKQPWSNTDDIPDIIVYQKEIRKHMTKDEFPVL